MILKPCPFCGSRNIMSHYVYVKCMDCGAEGPPVNSKQMDEHVDYVDRENAMKLWNERKRAKRPKIKIQTKKIL